MGFAVKRSVVLVSVLVGLAGAVVACSNATSRPVVPGVDTTGAEKITTEGTSPSVTTSRPSSGTSPLADIEPCSLLSAGDQAKLKVRGGVERELLSARTCRWWRRAQSETFPVDVLVYDHIGLDDLRPDLTINPLPNVGSHEAVQIPAKAGGACSVVMGVTESSRVATTAVAGIDVERGCALALEAARLVEPNVPSGLGESDVQDN